MPYSDTTVKLYRYNTDGFAAQSIDFSQPGSYIELLDKVLVDGYAPVAALGITVSSGVATMTITGHPFIRYNNSVEDGSEPQIGPILSISGATPSELNGEHRCLITGGNTLTFETTAEDGAASGTITARIPPLGWEKVYHDAGTHKAVYRSLNPAASGKMIQVTDNHAFTGWNAVSMRFAKIVGCEQATDANTPLFTFGSAYVPKYWWPSQRAMPWEITGNSMFFRIHCMHQEPAEPDEYGFRLEDQLSIMTAYGDFESYVIGDAYNFLIHGSGIPTSSNIPQSYLWNSQLQ
jgi:hypothetical protein